MNCHCFIYNILIFLIVITQIYSVCFSSCTGVGVDAGGGGGGGGGSGGRLFLSSIFISATNSQLNGVFPIPDTDIALFSFPSFLVSLITLNSTNSPGNSLGKRHNSGF